MRDVSLTGDFTFATVVFRTLETDIKVAELMTELYRENEPEWAGTSGDDVTPDGDDFSLASEKLKTWLIVLIALFFVMVALILALFLKFCWNTTQTIELKVWWTMKKINSVFFENVILRNGKFLSEKIPKRSKAI